MSLNIACAVRYGIETASSIGPTLWDKIPTMGQCPYINKKLQIS